MNERRGMIDNIMDVKEASEKWGLTIRQVQRLCKAGKVKCKQLGREWAIEKDQPNPKEQSK